MNSTLDSSKLVSRFSYLNKKLNVQTISGKSFVYATESISKGETVAVWGGRVVHRDEINTLLNETPFLQISEDLFMVSPVYDDGPDSISLIRHSSSPNCGFKGQISLVAMKDIVRGEEISYDPFMNAYTNAGGYLEKSIREKYYGYFSDYLQRKIDSTDALRIYPAFVPGAWGLLTSIDLESCDPDLIRSADAIKQYVVELCDLIEMKRFGETHVVHFGEDERVAGYSMLQLIETSCISAHFANETNTSYIDIFSCKAYDPEVASNFTKNFFKGGTMRLTVTNRF
jgi:S-adenosylmethionine/arginine decarboxylase-like enzyme